MAPKPASILIVALIALALTADSDASPNIGVYWGQDDGEGTLAEACGTGKYKYVFVGSLTTFGNNQVPVLNLTKHCNPAEGGCTALSNEIKQCQKQKVKVIFAIGGIDGSYSLSSSHDARQVADYLWNSYLGGTSEYRPFGDAVFDGIDFDIEMGSANYYDDLAYALKRYSKSLLLSAAPQCPYPDAHHYKALSTGLFDLVCIQYYNNRGCDYVGGVDGIITAWNLWKNNIDVRKLFVALPASPAAACSGYIPPQVLQSEVLSKLGGYGGVILLSRYYDIHNNYSDQILPALKDQMLDNIPMEDMTLL